jgi:mRNA interferase MazF
MKEGDVLLVSLPQANGQHKPRPAILLRLLPPFSDYLVCGVSSQLRQRVRGLDETILRSDMDFAGSGLRTDSLIRVGFLAVYTPQQIIGSIGKISGERHRRLLQQLAEFLTAAP